MAKRRISKNHTLTFRPEKWNEMIGEAKKINPKWSVSKYLVHLHDKFKNT